MNLRVFSNQFMTKSLTEQEKAELGRAERFEKPSIFHNFLTSISRLKR